MNITNIQKAIAGEKLDGWLFFNFLHRDPLSDQILGIDPEKINSRPWYFIVPASGDPVKICHAVEPGQLDNLPGKKFVYSSRAELLEILKQQCLNIGNTMGAQYSKELTTVSTLDHGTALFLQDAGFKLMSSAGLIQRLTGLIDKTGIESHKKAAAELYDIVDIVWKKISRHFAALNKDLSTPPLLEREVQKWILDEFEKRGMESGHLPIVACGSNSGNPHYAPEDHDNPIKADAVLQLDIWAQFKKPGSIFADISWVGWTGKKAPEDVEKMFSAVKAARDRCTSFIAERLSENMIVTGFEADFETRKVLIDRGYKDLIKHRTGHGIDINVHGSGAGLDSVEFPDRRTLLDGACFSVEPGLYSEAFGMRTEIDAYIQNGEIIISGPGPQTEILTIKD